MDLEYWIKSQPSWSSSRTETIQQIIRVTVSGIRSVSLPTPHKMELCMREVVVLV